MNQSYRTDLTDEQWPLLETLIPPAKPGGRPRSVEMRSVVNAIFTDLRLSPTFQFQKRAKVAPI